MNNKLGLAPIASSLAITNGFLDGDINRVTCLC